MQCTFLWLLQLKSNVVHFVVPQTTLCYVAAFTALACKLIKTVNGSVCQEFGMILLHYVSVQVISTLEFIDL